MAGISISDEAVFGRKSPGAITAPGPVRLKEALCLPRYAAGAKRAETKIARTESMVLYYLEIWMSASPCYHHSRVTPVRA